MEELILDEPMLNKIADYCVIRKYSYDTWETYMFYLKKIAKKYHKINQQIAFLWLKNSSNPNQTAIISLINNFCIDNSIDFYLKSIRVRKKERKVPEVLSFGETKNFVEVIPMPYSLMVRCLFNIGAGIRISELVKMRYGKFNWAEWIEDKSKQGFMLITNSKRGKSRPQNVPPALMQELYDYAKDNGLINEMNIPEDVLVFDFGIEGFRPELREEDKEKWNAKYIRHARDIVRYNIFRKYGLNFIKNYFGGRSIHLHTFRHSRATNLLNDEGKTLEEIKELLGHRDISVTMIYAHLNRKKIIEGMKDVHSI